MEIGDRVRLPITRSNAAAGASDSALFYTGRVIYIHPRGRYYTAELDLPGGGVRESYFFEGRRFEGRRPG